MDVVVSELVSRFEPGVLPREAEALASGKPTRHVPGRRAALAEFSIRW